MAQRGAPATTANALDAVIVGGGAIGLACAWRAAQRGLRVRVLERDEPGSGASGVAAGMLAPVGETTFGEERLLEIALASHVLWPDFADELSESGPGAAAKLLRNGALHVALDPDEARELERNFELMQSLGLEAEWLRGRECRELEPGLGPSVAGGISAPHEAGVDPSAVVDALVVAARAAGAEVITGCEVTGAIWDGESLNGVVTADGEHHRAETTVLAAGAWSGAVDWLPEDARPPVRPVKGQILTLRGNSADPVASRIVVTERVYMVPRADGRLIVGATVEEMGFDDRVTAGGVHEILREAYRALPDVAELELERAVVGHRPGTPDNVPLIGWAEVDGLLCATGHFRNGILLAPITAQGVAALLAGEEPPAVLDGAKPGRFSTVVGS